MATQRIRGIGSIYQRNTDGLWLASVPAPAVDGKRRKRVIATGKDRAKVQAALDAWREANPAAPVLTRAESMAAARALGTHTYAEMTALIRAADTCRYCGIGLDVNNRVEDHIVSVARGGSDAIDNLQVICWECNMAKRDNDHYVYDGKKPRPYKPLPMRDRVGWFR